MRSMLTPSVVRSLWAALPRGASLPVDVWDRRHHVIVVLVGLHGMGLVGFGLLTGHTLGHSVLEGAGIVAFALLASVKGWSRRVRSSFASVGLVISSAVLVHLSGGYIEMHFHFFVMVGLLALYQDWTPFLVAIGFVVVHHGLVGALNPADVYNHPAAWARPWRWAAIHGVFVLAASAVSVAAWRLHETVQSQLRELNTVLGRQALELRIKNAELDSFVSSISHDLKTPLVALHGMAGALLEGYGRKLDTRGCHYLERVQANVILMESLIANLRTLSWIGRESHSFQAVDLADVVTEVLAELAEPIRARGVKVVVSGTGTFWGVRKELQQVFTSLVSNAVKYLGDTTVPTVEIGTLPGDGTLECYVRDNGIGIDSAYHAKIFETFERLKDVPGDGTGVGLTIVKKIVEAVGGRVWIESSEAQGTTLWFTWPTAPAPMPVV